MRPPIMPRDPFTASTRAAPSSNDARRERPLAQLLDQLRT